MNIQKTRDELSDLIYDEVKSNFSSSSGWIWLDNFADENDTTHFMRQLHTTHDVENKVFASDDDVNLYVEGIADEIVSALKGNRLIHMAAQVFTSM